MELTSSIGSALAPPEFLVGGGEMGQLIRDFDWSKTSLGPVYTWPQSLRTCIRIMLDSRQPIWIGWGKELIKFYNDPYKAIVGGKHPWALGEPASVVWKDIWHDIDPMLKQVMEEGKGTYVESQLLIMERNGYPEETYYTFSYTPIPGDDGKTAGMFCANTDDTDRITSDRQLRTLIQLGKQLTDCKTGREVMEKTIETLQDNPYDFPFALFRQVENNKAVLKHHTPLGPAVSLVPGEIDLNSAHPISITINRAIETKRPQVFQNLPTLIDVLPAGAWNVPPDKALVLPVAQSGKEPYGLLTIGLNPFRLPDEKYLSFFSLVADQIATSFSDVYAFAEERKRAEALAAIDQAKTAFFTNISHEFRTPLTLMLGSLEEIMSRQQENENTRAIETAHRNSMRLLRLVNNLLDFSRIEAGKAKAKFSATDIGQFTADLASNFRSVMEQAGLDFQIRIGSISGLVYIDKEMWEKIVLNLLSNAFKYTLRGSVTLSLSQEDDQVALIVTDTGIGIPESEQPKMFQRFHRVQNVTGRTYEGTGIGLSLVSELVKLHNGSIKVTSKEGEGSTFSVVIPNRKHFSSEDTSTEKQQFTPVLANVFIEEATSLVDGVPHSGTSITPVDSNKATILIVDDNADMRRHIQTLLDKEYNVVMAGNGQEALNKIREYKPNLIVSDVMMPVMDGIQLVKTVKDNAATVNLPILLLSARAGEEAKIEGFDTGADDYLIKPFSAKELMARVRSQINLAKKRGNALQDVYNLFDDVPFAVGVLKGEDLIIEYVNKYNLAIWNCRKEDVIGKPLFEARPDIRDSALPIHQEVYRSAKRFTAIEVPINIRNNDTSESRFFNVTIDPMFDDQGKMIGQLATSIDVTEQIQARKKIEESESYFRKLADTAPATLWITEKDGSCSYLSRAWYEMTGQTEEEALGFGWLEATHPEDKSRTATAFMEANGAHLIFDCLYRLRQHDGTYRWAIDKGIPRFDDKGTFLGFIGAVVDVHEQRTAQLALEESKEMQRLAIEAAGIGTWGCDLATGIVTCSEKTKELFGCTENIVSLETIFNIIAIYDREKVKQAIDAATKHPYGIYHAKYDVVNALDGTVRSVVANGKVFFDQQRNPVKFFGTSLDVTKQKRANDYLEEQVKLRTSQLNKLNNILQQSNIELQQFAHVASHDLKEPLRKIRTFAGRLVQDEENRLSPRSKIFLDKINSASERMFTMIEGVLNYSVVNASEQRADLVDLNQILQNVETDLELPIAQKAAVLEYKKLTEMEGSGVLLYQLFYNLVNNSLKFSKTGIPPKIKIKSTVRGNIAEIVVQDNGIGFEQEYAENIFESFTRLNSKDQFEGTGLGLSLCKRIVERHGGHIEAKGHPGQGAEFIIQLPLRQVKNSL
jgi:PAS domain S-box-containing protein